MRDLTERQQAQAAIRQNAALLDQTYDALFVWDLTGTITFWNRGAEELYGYSRAEALGRRCHELLHTHVEGGLEGVLQALDRDGRWEGGLRHQTRDGRWITGDSRMVLVRRPEGEVVLEIVRDSTERRHAEEVLRASEGRFRLLFAGNPLPMWVYDLQTLRFVEVNDAAVARYGYSREEFLRLRLTDIRPAEDIHLLHENLAQVRQALEASGPWRHQLKDGRIIDVEITSHLLDGEGRGAALVVAQDVTERKRAQDELLFKTALLEAQSETTIDGILVVDVADQVLLANKRFGTMWNLPEGAIDTKDDKKMIEYVRPQVKDPDAFLAKVRCLNSQPAEESRDELELKDGRVFDRYSSPLRGPTGKVYGRIWYFRDITERKQAEAERVRLVAAIEQSAEAVVITNPKGDIEYVNPAFTHITGHTREEAVGKNPRMLKSERQNPDFYQQLWQTILAGKPWHGELINRRKDGAHYTEQMSIAPVKDVHGEVTHFIATKQDVTERRTLEAQLQQAAKVEAVGRLAGGVAHDFNNLLTVINGYSEILAARLAADEKARDYLQEIKNAGERAASLTRQLLAFSRRQVLAPQVLDLNLVVANLEKMLRRLIGEDVKLRTVLDASLERVKADPGQIEQVLMNLAVNARDAMPLGGNLTIETRNVELDEDYTRNHATVKPGPHVMLAISDTGAGMSPEIQAHIFEPFFTTKEQGKGTGLGLATVYGIVKQSEGSIWLYSEEGQGTVFKVYFPVVRESLAEREPAKVATDSASGSETVLVVEDEEGVRSLVRVALASGGYRVLESKDAESAVALCAHHSGPIHLLLTDVVMPQMSGPMVARSVAALRPGIKVLYMSGYTDDAVVHHGVLGQDMPFIQKPFSPLALRKKIREVLGRGGALAD